MKRDKDAVEPFQKKKKKEEGLSSLLKFLSNS